MQKYVKVIDHYYAYSVNAPMVILKEDVNNFYACDAFSYDWLLYTNKLKWLEGSDLIEKFDKKVFHYVQQYQVSKKHIWAYRFPLKELDKKHFHFIAEIMFWISKDTDNSFTNRLEITIKRFRKYVPKELIRRILEFLLTTKEGTMNRARILMSPLGTEFLDE
jgi:hypothetical protein